MESRTVQKNLDIEIMRIIAVFFVIFNHTGNGGFFLFSLYDSHSIQYWLYLFISVFCKVSVPLLFMITGALMLKRDPEPLRILWNKRISRIGMILLVWSLFYYSVNLFRNNQVFSIKKFIKRLFESNWNFSFWYLYAYIALLITLPFLQRMAKSLSNKEYIYLIGLMFVFSSFLPLTQYYIWQGEHYLNGNLNPGWLFLNIVFYPCLGYFLQCRCEKIWNKKRIALLWLVNILVIWITCYMTYYKASITGVCEEAQSQDFHFAFVYVNCISIFITCQYFFKKVIVGNNIQTLIRSLGECTFGIYLIHSFFLKMPVMIMIFDALQMKYEINPMVSALIFSFLIFMTSYFVIVIIKKIPVLQKLC